MICLYLLIGMVAQEAAKWIVSDDAVEFRVGCPISVQPPPESTLNHTLNQQTKIRAAGLDHSATNGGQVAVSQSVSVFAQHAEKLPALLTALAEHGAIGGCLLFAKTKSRCNWLVKKLQAQHMDGAATRTGGGGGGAGSVPTCRWIRALHSGLSQPIREQTLLGYLARLSIFLSWASGDTTVVHRGQISESSVNDCIYHTFQHYF